MGSVEIEEDLTHSEERARTFGGPSALDALYNSGTGQYYMPDISAPDQYAAAAGPDANAPLAAIIDTGVLAEHPLLKPRLAEQRDFTGTGCAVTNGHGSQVAIRLVLVSPNVRLLSAKVLADDDAPAAVQTVRIGEGIRWATGRSARIMVVCVGFLSDCGPKHEYLCTAVREALDSGAFVWVAGEATCPALCDPRIDVIGELNPDGSVDSNVPPDFVFGTPGRVRIVPWEDWSSRQPTEKEVEQ